MIRPDTFNTDFSKKKSQFEVTGYTQFICLLENFASIRATMGKRESYTLGDILLEEIGESKYEYEGDITDALYVDFEGFLKYSLYDSFRLYQLEEKNKDIDLLYKMSLMTATRFSKVMTKTVSIRNFAAMVLEGEGFILSNNHNKHKDHGEKEKFRGAFVALSKLMDPVGIELNGVRSAKVYENVIDEDLASLYPSIILAWNIDADTMVGKIRCYDKPELDDEIPALLAEADYVKIGNQLLGLPTVSDVLKNLEKYLS
jgi:DNA polymerase elongation subunit (family B)